MNVLAVGIGGFFGAIMRYTIGKMIALPSGFPLGTLLINLLGCFFLAWFFTIISNRKNMNPNLILAIGTGFTGAFTTFSTFSVETLNLLQDQQFISALSYVLISILGGIALAIMGVKLASLKARPTSESKGETE